MSSSGNGVSHRFPAAAGTSSSDGAGLGVGVVGVGVGVGDVALRVHD